MKNITKEVAKLLDVELEEEFRLKDFPSKFKITENGMMFWSNTSHEWCNSSGISNALLTGKREIIKISKSILDDIEKEYLLNIIKPFRKNIITIRKTDYYEHEYIEIFIYRPGEIVSCEAISFPYFNKGKMYKGMEIDKEYSLKELGL